MNLQHWAKQHGLLDGSENLTKTYRIGLIDAFINPQTINIQNANIFYKSFTPQQSQVRNTRNEHGNLMASMICGQKHSPFQGLLPNAKLYFSNATRYKDSRANGVAVARAIDWMRSNNTDVILLPFGMMTNSKLVDEAIEQAANKGITLVAGAGNHGDDALYYPARHPRVVAVTAANKQGNCLEGYCGFPQANAHVLAEEVPSYSDSGHTTIQGTSPACILWGLLHLVNAQSIRKHDDNVHLSIVRDSA